MIRTVVAVALLSLLLHSCNKDYNAGTGYTLPDPNTTAGPYASMALAMHAAAPPITSQFIDAATGGSIRAQGGSRFLIPQGAFVDASGNPVSGQVDVKVNDWLKRGDMVFGKVLPIDANGESLESGGQVWIEATQNGKVLELTPGKTVDVYVPQFGTPVPGMEIYEGTSKSGAASNVQWNRADSFQRVMTRYLGDTIVMSICRFRYYNLDKEYSNSQNKQSVTLRIANEDGSTIAGEVYGFVENFRAITAFGSVSGSGTAADKRSIPADWKVHLVAMCLKDGHFYGGVFTVDKPASGQIYTVKVKKTEPLVFRSVINSL